MDAKCEFNIILDTSLFVYKGCAYWTFDAKEIRIGNERILLLIYFKEYKKSNDINKKYNINDNRIMRVGRKLSGKKRIVFNIQKKTE